jgi:pyruvate formate lyase activating enzyme
MQILGFIPTSLVDWDKKVASIIFVGGCNFHCPYCQNHPIASEDNDLKPLEWEDIKKKLTRRRQWIDGVVVSGGEPMMHPEIFGLLAKIKYTGFKTKIDTNGSFPYPLKEAIELKLVDSVAMDVKTILDNRYWQAVGRKYWLIVLERTIRLLKESGVDYEFRTTLVPGIVKPEDLVAIVKQIAPVKKYVIQQFVPANSYNEKFQKKKAYLKEDIEKFIPVLKQYANKVVLRGFG